ncbi:MAG: Eco57I restriction-modification methylase domain-containing protein [Candidatus Aenigmatarchaeota archaeon]
MGKKNIIKHTVDIIDSFNSFYSHLTHSLAKNYLDYVERARQYNKSDEETLIQPKLFPAFLEEILDFSKIDYVTEERNDSNMAPDFTPVDTNLHPFIFETKGNDSGLNDFEEEFHSKSKRYVRDDPHAKYAIITNMAETVVYDGETEEKIEDYSFSFIDLYLEFKNEDLFDIKNENIQSFLRFVKKFHKKELTTDKKIEAIADAHPYPPLFGKPSEGRETIKLTGTVRSIVNILKDDVKYGRGKEYILRALANDSLRREQIAREIYSICQNINSQYQTPESEKIEVSDLVEIFESNNNTIVDAVNLYFHRVAYFTMSRLLLLRVWEDARFIEPEYVTLYNGGFKKWYKAYNEKILRVLEQAYNIGKDKYEWLFTERNNYSWYIPTEKVLVDVLYELAKHNLSVINRDVLGTVYEEYLDLQDKKNKGQYYTPHQIVSFILDRVGYASKQWGEEKGFFDHDEKGNRQPKLLFDPATGSGGFLVEAINRLRNFIAVAGESKRDYEDARDAVINGLHGSEISAFSYYLTEVNVLIQLTPIIQKIIQMNSKERELSGKFTLSTIHQDSLALHNPPRTITERDVEDDFKVDKDHDILKLEGEKLRIFKTIKENANFDYTVANPPYIGEDNHKDLFRSTLAKYPYWERYYQGKMDYLYFFVILALQKLNQKGRLGFITTSYWPTADGASKLRRYILDNAKIVEIIDFGEIKLFEHAKGQHNMVFVLEKCHNEEQKEENQIKIVKVKKKFSGESIPIRLSKLIKHIKSHIDKKDYSDEYIEVFYSAVKQGELSEEPWHIYYREKEGKIINRVKKQGKQLQHLCDVHQGLVPNPLRVDNRVLRTLTQTDKNQYHVKKGDGVFVLSNKEIKDLDIPENEKDILKPYYKNSSIHRYYVNLSTNEKVIYTTPETDPEKYPNIIGNHLAIFKRKLSARREVEQGKIPWYSLHWPREQYIFEEEKIICPYRSKRNVFAYTDKPFYGSTDMYFITNKKSRSNQIDAANNTCNEYDLKYILGILNSSLFRVWCHHKTKPKGDMRELFYTPLTNMPIKLIDFENDTEVKTYTEITEAVSDIIDMKNQLSEFGHYFAVRMTFDEKQRELPDLEEEEIIRDLANGMKRNMETSNKLHCVGNNKDQFIFREAKEVTLNLDQDEPNFSYSIAVIGKNKKCIRVLGEKNILSLLRRILNKNYKGKSWDEIKQRIILPNEMDIYQNKISEIIDKVKNILETIETQQKFIDKRVCELYGITKEDVNTAIEKLF